MLLQELRGSAIPSTVRDKVKKQNNDRQASHDLEIFSFETISAATRNFSTRNKIGEGGFGPVYKVLSLSLSLYTYIYMCVCDIQNCADLIGLNCLSLYCLGV